MALAGSVRTNLPGWTHLPFVTCPEQVVKAASDRVCHPSEPHVTRGWPPCESGVFPHLFQPGSGTLAVQITGALVPAIGERSKGRGQEGE